MSISTSDFEVVRQLVRQRSAIQLEDGKEYLAVARLTPLLREEGLGALDQLVARLRQPYSPLHQRVVEAMTTNETSFFRDNNPFEALRKNILPNLISQRSHEKRLKIWCGACSTGQEPYTIAMLLREHFPLLANWDVYIMASDINTQVLEAARQGRYSQLEVNRGLPAAMLVKYFARDGAKWQIREELRKTIDFRQLNLVQFWPAMPSFDLILLRNVLIYFDVETKRTILQQVRRVMRADAYLILGGAETALNVDDSLETLQLEKSTCCRLRRTDKARFVQ